MAFTGGCREGVWYLPIMSDPYQPPAKDRQGSGNPLYSVPGIALATFIGSLAAGVVLLFLNYRALGRKELARSIAIWGGGLFLVILLLTSFLPMHLGLALAIGVAQAALAFFVADRLQGAAIRYHQQNQGAMHSEWRAAGVGILTGLISLNIAAVIIALMGAPA